MVIQTYSNLFISRNSEKGHGRLQDKRKTPPPNRNCSTAYSRSKNRNFLVPRCGIWGVPGFDHVLSLYKNNKKDTTPRTAEDLWSVSWYSFGLGHHRLSTKWRWRREKSPKIKQVFAHLNFKCENPLSWPSYSEIAVYWKKKENMLFSSMFTKRTTLSYFTVSRFEVDFHVC